MQVRFWRALLPRMAILAVALIAGAGAAVVAAPPAPSSASVGTVSFSTTPGLFPAFDPAISDYVLRCAGGPVQVAVTNSDSSDVTTTTSVDGQTPQTGSFVAPVTLGYGQEFNVTVTEGATSKQYFVRCLPSDFPTWSVDRPGTPQSEYYVVSPALGGGPQNKYITLFDTNGVPVWWYAPPGGRMGIDAKIAPDGNVLFTEEALSTRLPLDAQEVQFNGLSVATVTPDGYAMNEHEIQLLPNGDYLLIGNYSKCCYDLTAYGGNASSTLLDEVAQEVTPAGAAVWTWDSADHIGLDEVVPQWWDDITGFGNLGFPYDVFHMNSVTMDDGGNLLISERYEGLYKVNNPLAATDPGKIIWKLGGLTPTVEPGTQLSIVGDAVFDGGGDFGGQHYARFFDAGDGNEYVTLHDNGTNTGRPPRALRYQIDETAHTATLVEDVTDTTDPPFRSLCCGSAKRLPGGDWVTGWGYDTLTMELTPTGDRAFVLTLDEPSYRTDPVLPGVLTRDAMRTGMDAQYVRSRVDTDGDGCPDGNERGANPSRGGQRDPNDAYDFYDVPVPALRLGYNGQGRDGGIGVGTDLLALLDYAGLTSSDADYAADYDGNGVADGLQYDRSPSVTAGEPWRSGPPDGAIGLGTDVLAMLEQTGDSCQ